MYRIEVVTGEETVFRTVEELATGIRNGLITPRCRIYHAASQKWLPIEFHPHYKKAVELVTGGAPVIDTGDTRAPQAAPPRRSPAPSFAPAPTPPPVAFKPAPAPPVVPEPEAPVRPKPMPWESPAPVREPHAAAAPPVVEAPAQVELPRISYPEVSTSEPAEPQPVARRRAGGGGSTVLGGLVVAAVIGAWLALRSNRPAAAEAAAPRAEQPAASSESDFGNEPAFPDESPVSQPPATEATVPAPAPKVVARPTGPVSQAWSSSAGAIAVTPPAAPATPTPSPEIPVITPPPAELDLTLGKLPSGDSLMKGVTTRDSGAISRILKAVSEPAGAKKTNR